MSDHADLRPAVRSTSLGQDAALKPADRFGVWLSQRKVLHAVGSVEGKRVADFGSGYDAHIARRLGASAATLTVVDVALSPDLATIANTTAIEGTLPGVLSGLEDASLDVVLCVSVLEHLDEPDTALSEFRRLLAPGGTCFINVPSWLGKIALEFSAFRLQLSESQRIEMDDHRRYYDPRDLWPMLVRAGFMPHGITCRRHKFGLNTYAVCRLDR